eukprot:gene4734-5357_t
MAATVVENRNLMCCMGLPCFVHNTDTDDDEEIVCSSKGGNTAASPGEDVWRKLGFPPTPPRSPTKSFGEITQNHSTIAERLQLVFESLDDCFGHVDSLPNLDSLSLRSKLIQDCMWNGIVSEREKCLTFIESIYDTPCSTPPPLDYSSSDCVDPSSVFPYPLNESKQQTQSEDSVLSIVNFKLFKCFWFFDILFKNRCDFLCMLAPSANPSGPPVKNSIVTATMKHASRNAARTKQLSASAFWNQGGLFALQLYLNNDLRTYEFLLGVVPLLCEANSSAQFLSCWLRFSGFSHCLRGSKKGNFSAHY